MSLFLFLVFGLVVGVLARLIVPGREPGGWVASLILGVLGSYMGGYLGRALGMYREGGAAGFLMSIVGACLLLVIYHAVMRGRARA